MSAVDWPKAIELAKDTPGEWVLAGNNVSASVLTTVRKRGNALLRAVNPPLEARMPHRVGHPPRGDLFICYYGERERPSSDRMYRPITITTDLRSRLSQRAEENGVSVTLMVNNALRRVARYGSRAPERVTLGVKADRKLWNRAVDKAKADGFSLADALRSELERELRGE